MSRTISSVFLATDHLLIVQEMETGNLWAKPLSSTSGTNMQDLLRSQNWTPIAPLPPVNEEEPQEEEHDDPNGRCELCGGFKHYGEHGEEVCNIKSEHEDGDLFEGKPVDGDTDIEIRRLGREARTNAKAKATLLYLCNKYGVDEEEYESWRDVANAVIEAREDNADEDDDSEEEEEHSVPAALDQSLRNVFSVMRRHIVSVRNGVEDETGNSIACHVVEQLQAKLNVALRNNGLKQYAKPFKRKY